MGNSLRYQYDLLGRTTFRLPNIGRGDLGIRTEYAGAFLRSDHVAFVDLGDVPELFAVPLPPRVTLFNLPAEGRWFEPVGQRRPAAAPDTDELDLG